MDEPTHLEITSEIYGETDFRSLITKNGSKFFIDSLFHVIVNFLILLSASISQFSFRYPNDDNDSKQPITIDADGDLIVSRKRLGSIQIEHKRSTELSLVGLQVWRGALILADFLFHNRKKFAEKHLLELGSGVGLTSIAASIYAERNIICTDIDLGGLLDLIRSNIELNKSIINNRVTVQVMELNFKIRNWSNELKKAVCDASVIIAADGKIYSVV